jgi:uncharacterized protein (DUF58 family)
MTSATDRTASGAFPDWSPSFQAALSRLAVSARRPAGSPYPGEVRSAARGRAIEFADYRPYIEGDEPSLVDWRVYARLGRLYVKRHQEERERTLTLLLDCSASMDFGEGEAHKGRFARRLAAALACISLSRHEPVRVWVLRDGGARSLAPAIALGDAPALFRSLASLRDAGRTSLGEAIERAVSARPRGPVILISDLLDAGWASAVRRLASHEAAVLQPLAPQEWEPSLAEEVELEDAETGDFIPVRMGPLEVEAYRQRFQALLHETAGESRRMGVLHVALHTDVPLAQTVLRTLTAAGVLTT